MLSQVLFWNLEETWTVYVSSSWLRFLETLCMSDVHYVLSSITLLSSFRLMPMASFMESIYLIFGLSLFLILSIFLSLFLKTLPFMVSLKQDSFRFVSFAFRNVSGLICYRIHLFVFLVSRISIGLFSNSIFQMNSFAPPPHQPSSQSNFCIYT